MNGGTAVPANVLSDAVTRALRAPSVHNTQPWLWRIDHGEIELHADPRRHLVDTDPDGRDLLISCGAALHHVSAALAATGIRARVMRFPDSNHTTHIATVRPEAGRPEAHLIAAALGIEARRTDRRQFGPGTIPDHVIASLRSTATSNGTVLHALHDDASRERLEDVLVDAGARQRYAPGYTSELMVWTHRYPGLQDGIPADSLPSTPSAKDGLRAFPPGRMSAPRHRRSSAHDRTVLLVLCTFGDTKVDWLLAGEATSAVLLAATSRRLATTPLSQALEVAASRRAIADKVLRTPDYPQLIIRLGFPVDGATLPRTPRRPLRSVLMPGRVPDVGAAPVPPVG
jgi:hypothetical protein